MVQPTAEVKFGYYNPVSFSDSILRDIKAGRQNATITLLAGVVTAVVAPVFAMIVTIEAVFKIVLNLGVAFANAVDRYFHPVESEDVGPSAWDQFKEGVSNHAGKVAAGVTVVALATPIVLMETGYAPEFLKTGLNYIGYSTARNFIVDNAKHAYAWIKNKVS